MAITDGNRRRFENLGARVVRNDIGIGVFIEQRPDREQALEWLAEIDRRRDNFLRWIMFGVTVVAAVAAVIAALRWLPTTG
jgi:hypothetical protein